MAGATKISERQYVALTWWRQDAWTHRPDYWIIAVGKEGQSKDSLLDDAEKEVQKEATSGMMWDTMIKNTFIVTLSAAKRSYKTAYNHWLESEPA